MDLFIGEAGAIGTHGGFREKNLSFKPCRVQLFLDSGIGNTVSKADLDVALEFFDIGNCIGIDGRIDFRTFPKKFV